MTAPKKATNVFKRSDFGTDGDMCGVQGDETGTQGLPLRGHSESRSTRAQVLPRLLATKEAARYLGISAWTLRQWYRRGWVFALRGHSAQWLWDRKDLDACVDHLKDAGGYGWKT